jgi:hypothetical protein
LCATIDAYARVIPISKKNGTSIILDFLSLLSPDLPSEKGIQKKY